MPHISGRELARRLAATRPRVRVLYMSGYTDDTIVNHGIVDPGIAFLQKPITPDVLLHKVREALDEPVTLTLVAPGYPDRSGGG
jgi:FixJ family two-component response regulator